MICGKNQKHYVNHQQHEAIDRCLPVLKFLQTGYIIFFYVDCCIWGTGLWSKGTYCASVGSISEASIKKYIEGQKIMLKKGNLITLNSQIVLRWNNKFFFYLYKKDFQIETILSSSGKESGWFTSSVTKLA